MEFASRTVQTTCLIFVFCILTGSPAVPLNAAEPPNFVIILVDDLGKHDLGCEGSTFYETPHIDQMAARSVRFVNGYSACQVCSPSRAALQTGRYPARTQITDYIDPRGGNQPEGWKRNTQLLPAAFAKQLALEEVTLAEALKPLGYHSYFAGKWHLGGEGFSPIEQGYDVNVGGDVYGTPPGGYFSPYRNPKLPDGPPGEQLPLRLARETASYIASRAESKQPFMALLSFYSVHAPIQTTQALWSKYRDKAAALGLDGPRSRFLLDRGQEVRQTQDNPLYAGMMESLDDAVGIVLDALQTTGQAENTVVIFTSDNGGVSSGDGYATGCLPLRGGKGRQWEGGVRQPFYVDWPGVTQGSESQALVSSIDLLPTLLEIAGGTAQVPANEAPVNPALLDGISLVPALTGGVLPDRPLFWHYPHYGNQGGEPSAIIRAGDWKLIRYYEDERHELYDLREDLGEQQNIAADHPQIVRDLSEQLAAWLRETGAKFPSANPAYDASQYASALKNLKETGIPNRERYHASLFQKDFRPQEGWWEAK